MKYHAVCWYSNEWNEKQKRYSNNANCRKLYMWCRVLSFVRFIVEYIHCYIFIHAGTDLPNVVVVFVLKSIHAKYLKNAKRGLVTHSRTTFLPMVSELRLKKWLCILVLMKNKLEWGSGWLRVVGGGGGVQMSVVSFKKFWPFLSSKLNDY